MGTSVRESRESRAPLSKAAAVAQVHHDNLEEARAEGRHLTGTGHGPPAITKEVREIARALIERPKYVTNLEKRLDEGTAGAMEIWLWRWAHGDPRRATEAGADETDRKFKTIRANVLTMLKEHAEEAEALASRLLARGQLPGRPPPAPEGDPLFELLEADD